MTQKKPFRHSNRYKYWYDKVYTIEQMKDYFSVGWHELIDDAFFLISRFPEAQICSAKRCFGMLHMFARCDDERILNAVEGILWKIERISASVCEGCGRMGRRRKELKNIYCFCNDCYLIHLNKAEDPTKLFVKGKGGLFKED